MQYSQMSNYHKPFNGQPKGRKNSRLDLNNLDERHRE